MARNTEGYRAAREWAQWFIGHPSWADDILWAYENPQAARDILYGEQRED